MARPPKSLLKDSHPHLAAQVVDRTLLPTLSTGSNSKIEWQCHNHADHRWFARVYNRTNAKNTTGCPICAGKVVLPGFNDVATTHPEQAKLLTNQSIATTITAQSNKKQQFTCDKNPNHTWTAPMSRLTKQGSGCPFCAGRTADKGATDLGTTHPELANQLVDQSLRHKLKAHSNKKVEWQCSIDPSHRWFATPDWRISKNSDCPQCSGRVVTPGVNDLATTHPHLATELKDPTVATTISQGSDKKVEWVCTHDPSHTWLSNPANRIKGSGCPTCANRRVQQGFNDLATTHPELVSKLYSPDDALTVTVGTKKKLRWLCTTNPDHVWYAEPSRFLTPRPPGCSECYKQHRSGPESGLVEILRTLLPHNDIITSDRSILGNNLELDIVISDKKLAIEFNGVWWHCEEHLADKNYHRNKTVRATRRGYQLIHVWEDEWFDKKNLIIRGIAHRLGVTDKLSTVLPNSDPAITQRIYARKLTPYSIDGAEARQFWIDNHLQGPVNSSKCYGLVDDQGDIRALLGIGKKNHGSRVQLAPGTWDIQRYATYGIVPGGFTKLLTYAEQHLRQSGEIINRWTSYSDDDISDGGMYRAAGFTIDHHQPPSYSYVGTRTNWRRSHRSNWTRGTFETHPDLEYQPGWTEHQAARANKLYRIYDAGKTRWVKDV